MVGARGGADKNLLWRPPGGYRLAGLPAQGAAQWQGSALNADKLIERARSEVARRNHDGAVVYYLQALAVDPGSRDARRGVREAALKKYEHVYPSGFTRALTGIGPRIGLILASMSRDHVKRMEAMEKVLAGHPRNTALGMALGAEAEAAGLAGAAAGAYEGILLADESHAGALKGLGRALRALGDIPGALAILERAVTVNPRDQEAQRLRKDLAAEGYTLDAGFATARTTHDLLKDKDQAKRLEQAQRIVRAEDDLEARVRAAREAAARTPDDTVALRELADAEFGLRNYAAAEKAMARACGILPDDIALRTRLGDIRLAGAERAVADARAAATGGDAGAAARVAALEKARVETFVAEYRVRVRNHPTDLALRYTLATHLEEAGLVDDAIAEYQHAVKDPRRRPETLGALGRCFYAKGMDDLAAKQLEKALEESRESGDRMKTLLYDLARVYERRGERERARDCLARILEVDIAYRDVGTWHARLKAAGTAS